MNDLDILTKFEWHDLPLKELSIDEERVTLLVTPFNDDEDEYYCATLRLYSYDNIELSIAGRLAPKDQRDLEVTTFDYKVGSDGLLSGTIGILPGNAGYWEISIENAHWSCQITDEPATGQP